MCKEGIRLARKMGYQRTTRNLPNSTQVVQLPARPDRVAFGVLLVPTTSPAQLVVDGNIDPATGNVAENVRGDNSGVLTVSLGTGGDNVPIDRLSWFKPSNQYDITVYGPQITEPVNIKSEYVLGATFTIWETWVEQDLENA